MAIDFTSQTIPVFTTAVGGTVGAMAMKRQPFMGALLGAAGGFMAAVLVKDLVQRSQSTPTQPASQPARPTGDYDLNVHAQLRLREPSRNWKRY